MNTVEGTLSVDKSKKVAIINARFNHFITDRLVEGAVDAYARHGGNHVLAVLFIILENYEPQLHVYRLIPFEFKEDAETHANKLIESFNYLCPLLPLALLCHRTCALLLMPTSCPLRWHLYAHLFD